MHIREEEVAQSAPTVALWTKVEPRGSSSAHHGGFLPYPGEEGSSSLTPLWHYPGDSLRLAATLRSSRPPLLGEPIAVCLSPATAHLDARVRWSSLALAPSFSPLGGQAGRAPWWPRLAAIDLYGRAHSAGLEEVRRPVEPLRSGSRRLRRRRRPRPYAVRKPKEYGP